MGITLTSKAETSSKKAFPHVGGLIFFSYAFLALYMSAMHMVSASSDTKVFVISATNTNSSPIASATASASVSPSVSVTPVATESAVSTPSPTVSASPTPTTSTSPNASVTPSPTASVSQPAENEVRNTFLRGDANLDGTLDISDSIVISNWVTRAIGALPCKDAADANDDGFVNLADVSWIQSYLFLSGPAPVQPYPNAGYDTTEDKLNCGVGIAPQVVKPKPTPTASPSPKPKPTETPVTTAKLFRRGDINADGKIDISDLPVLVSVFTHNWRLSCMDAADVNDDGTVDISDAVYWTTWFGQGGSVPPAPGPVTPGGDPTTDQLDCNQYPVPYFVRTGSLVKEKGKAAVYQMEDDKIRVFPNEKIFKSYGHSFKNVIEVNSLDAYKSGQPITDASPAPAVSPIPTPSPIIAPSPTPTPSASPVVGNAKFIRGDANLDGIVDISDSIWLTDWIVRAKGYLLCKDAADVNDDGFLNMVDVAWIQKYLFLSGPTPLEPFTSKGFDITADKLDCLMYPK